MPDMVLAQAIFQKTDLQGRSPNFQDGWFSEAQRLIEGYGQPAEPAEIPTEEAIFVCPFLRKWVAIVSVLGPQFRFLILDAKLYHFIPDPFAIVDRFPPHWKEIDLSAHEWPKEMLPARTVAQLDAILKTGDVAFLLGASQTLVDSGRVLIQKVAAPANQLFRELWQLLPDSTRRTLWVATYAYQPNLGFHLLAMPRIPTHGIPGYLSDEQVRDYPESRYERGLHVAIEAGDQRSLDQLLARRSSSETLRLASWVVVGAIVVAILSRMLMPR